MSDDQLRPGRLRNAQVWAGELRVGSVSALIADASGRRLVGLEVVGAEDHRRWFLPWVVCTIDERGVHTASPHLFLSEAELDFYVRHGVRLDPDDFDEEALETDGPEDGMLQEVGGGSEPR